MHAVCIHLSYVMAGAFGLLKHHGGLRAGADARHFRVKANILVSDDNRRVGVYAAPTQRPHGFRK